MTFGLHGEEPIYKITQYLALPVKCSPCPSFITIIEVPLSKALTITALVQLLSGLQIRQ